jgi:hypothetical protein
MYLNDDFDGGYTTFYLPRTNGATSSSSTSSTSSASSTSPKDANMDSGDDNVGEGKTEGTASGNVASGNVSNAADVEEGGEEGGHCGTGRLMGMGLDAHRVRPRQGSVLCFPQGNMASLVHEGSAVTRGVKYVVRTDVLYMLERPRASGGAMSARPAPAAHHLKATHSGEYGVGPIR